MGQEQKPDELPVDASQALERLLSRENQISDLVAFLATLDPSPFLKVLGLPGGDARVRREVRLGGQAGNADLIVSNEDGPIALLEVKASAAQHGDQFDRYDAWAKEQNPPVRCYLIALDGEAIGAPDGWTAEPGLSRLVRCWEDSSNLHAAWLASATAEVFDRWTAQADGKLASAAGPIVGDLIARRIETALLTTDHPTGIDLLTRATRQSRGGAAMVLAWIPFPGNHHRAWLCADLRSHLRDHPAAPWLLRLGVEVESSGDNPVSTPARVTAHDLAKPILNALTCTSLAEALREAGDEDLATAMKPRTRTRDGLRTRPSERVLDEWREKAQAGADIRHPVLFNDNLDNGGYRIGSLIEVDVTNLDRSRLAHLMLTALAHAQAAATAK
jgi:hypothetical protein